MSKKKIILTTTVVGLGILGVNKEANATLKSKIGRIFSGVMRSSGNETVVDNLRGDSRLLQKAKEMEESNLLSGRRLVDFSESYKPSILKDTFYYYQTRTDLGELMTVTSVEKPKIVKIEGQNVLVKVKDPETGKQLIGTEGVPIWNQGKDIKRNTEKILEERIQRYFESMEGVQVESYFDGYSENYEHLTNKESLELLGAVGGTSPILQPKESTKNKSIFPKMKLRKDSERKKLISESSSDSE